MGGRYEIADAIIRESIANHAELRPGLLESVYGLVLACALWRDGCGVERQQAVTFRYPGVVFSDAASVPQNRHYWDQQLGLHPPQPSSPRSPRLRETPLREPRGCMNG
jgi:hypothetical protein